jgi:hypothetical protein
MKILAIFVFLIIGNICHGQRITFNDLKYGITHTLGETDDYLLGKGLTFTENRPLGNDTPNTTGHLYSKNGDKKTWMSYMIVNNLNIIYKTSFTTYNLDEYIKLRTQIKALGFKLKKTENIKTTSYNDYEKGNISVTFSVLNYNNDKQYSVSVRDIRKFNLVYDLIHNKE